jgi:hypothetical protein
MVPEALPFGGSVWVGTVCIAVNQLGTSINKYVIAYNSRKFAQNKQSEAQIVGIEPALTPVNAGREHRQSEIGSPIERNQLIPRLALAYVVRIDCSHLGPGDVVIGSRQTVGRFFVC